MKITEDIRASCIKWKILYIPLITTEMNTSREHIYRTIFKKTTQKNVVYEWVDSKTKTNDTMIMPKKQGQSLIYLLNIKKWWIKMRNRKSFPSFSKWLWNNYYKILLSLKEYEQIKNSLTLKELCFHRKRTQAHTQRYFQYKMANYKV